MRHGYQSVAVAAAGHQAVLDSGRSAKLPNQEKTGDQKQQDDGDTDKTGGLARSDRVVRGFLHKRTMCIQTTLLLRRGLPSA